MLSTVSMPFCVVPARPVTSIKRTVRCDASGSNEPRGRRAAIRSLGIAGLAALAISAQPAQARNIEDAEKAKEARRAALRAAAQESAETGVGESAFANSNFAVQEGYVHSRQDEGIRKQKNI